MLDLLVSDRHAGRHAVQSSLDVLSLLTNTTRNGLLSRKHGRCDEEMSGRPTSEVALCYIYIHGSSNG